MYFSGTHDSPVEEHVYRVAISGGPPTRLTEPGYHHHADFDPQGQFFFDHFSNLSTPPKLLLRHADGHTTTRHQYRSLPPVVLRIPTPHGRHLNATLIRPPHRPGRPRLPVVMFVYGGPHAPAVRNHWEGQYGLIKQALAQKGFLVCTCDPYSASGEGAVSAWEAYQRLGATELHDLHWLAEHEQADLARVAIEGFSYGGFLVAYALTHSTMFKVGVAGAPVCDWRNYDSIYTERFMRLPQNNPDGYQTASVRAAAHRLHGRLLLVHGTEDDNVHLQNTLQLIHDLQAAGKEFDLMLYPGNGHGIGHNRQHWLKLWLGYIERNL